MLARVADSLYWMARSVERADTYARLLEVSHAMTLESADANGAGRRTVWEPLVDITGDLEHFLETHRRADERSVAWFLSFSNANPNSVISCLQRARQNAHAVRDLLPTEVWEALNAVYLDLRSWPAGRITREGVYPFSRQVRRASALLQGLIDQGMRHDASWHFLRMGRYVERAEKTARLLEVKFHLIAPADPAMMPGAELHQWRSLLRSVGADEAYLQLDMGLGSPREIARFLVVDHHFPRSVAHCLDQVAEAMDALVGAGDMVAGSPPLALIATARSELADEGSVPWNGALGAAMDRVQRRCNEIDAAVAASCFAYPSGREGGPQRAQAARQAQN
ncbi:MAG: alpha-E domain-containing protein [Thermoleophilia bacterium]